MEMYWPLRALFAVFVVAAITGHNALANVRPNEDAPSGLFVILPYALARDADAAPDTGSLRKADVASETLKARIVTPWLDQLLKDPVVAIAVPDGAPELEARLRDDPTREHLIKSGVVRLSQTDRLAYFMLLVKYFSKAARGDCRGVTTMQEIVDRISLGSMSDIDGARYLQLIHVIVIRSLLAAPITLPTSAQFETALGHLDKAVDAELSGDPRAIARMSLGTSGAPGATMDDVCWASSILMHLVIEMDNTDRDALLLYMLGEDEPARTLAPDSAPGR